MRFLALETSIGKMKKEFIAEGEKELLISIHHMFSFLLPAAGMFLVTFGVFVVYISLITLNSTLFPFFVPSLFLWLFFCIYKMLKYFINWRYNYFFVTTEKVIIVNHVFFIKQKIHPIHLEDIRSMRTESQFFGIGHCGTLFLSLNEKTEGSSDLIRIRYLPKPDVIMGVIEKATVLKMQRVPTDQGLQDQMDKVSDVQDKAQELAGQSDASVLD
ncbi:MAG: hypothetical protein PHZ00_00805 [Candidatus Peribacteraceae bacterium]|nr:hypothetical protein [Candidatus Peribacteraceae bacterium]